LDAPDFSNSASLALVFASSTAIFALPAAATFVLVVPPDPTGIPTQLNVANMRNTENRNNASGETKRARSPWTYRRVNWPGLRKSNGKVRQIFPSK
jgi:hypothetical protein